ncbi:MAG: hypothetical protein HKN80_11235 [Acidimicrobiia bacterium]|nr:hypothetical protein [Acidimicrobiia bacterium]
MTWSDRSRLAGLIAAEGVLVAGVLGLSRTRAFTVDPSAWVGGLNDMAFEDAAGSMVLLIALGLSCWLLLSTVGYLGASFSGRPAVVGAARRLTPAPIRRLVRRAAALSLAASAVTGPFVPAVADAAGGGSAARVILAVNGRGQSESPAVADAVDGDARTPDVFVPPHLRPLPGPSAEDETGSSDARDGSIERRVTVRRGDHLWGLSEQHLQRVLGRASLGEHEIARYWVQVIAANRDVIRSGDPDLVHPGEVITLPRVHEQ